MALLQVNFSPRALLEADGYDLNQVETPGGPLPRRDRA